MGTNFTKAPLFAAMLTDAVATDGDFTGATLDSVLDRRHAEIIAVLQEFNVPLLEMHP